MTLNFEDQAMGHVHVSWLDSHEIRRITIVDSTRMALFDDIKATEKLEIYDKGVGHNADYYSIAEYDDLRLGDFTLSHIHDGRPPRTECDHFLHLLQTRAKPSGDGLVGLRVVEAFWTASISLNNNDNPIKLTDIPS